jgi:hypothetical protein
MSYAFNWRINIDTHKCAISGNHIHNGDQVMDVNRESLQRYGLFLSEQHKIKNLVGTPLIGEIMSYIIDINCTLVLRQFCEVTQTTRIGRITKKPLRLSDAKFLPGSGGGKSIGFVDQYDGGYDNGAHFDNEKGWCDFSREKDSIYNTGDIVDDEEEIITYSSAGEEEEEWESEDSEDENSCSDWCSSGEEDEKNDDDSEPEYDVFEDGK